MMHRNSDRYVGAVTMCKSRPLGEGRVGQQTAVGLRDRCVQERLPVGVPSPDGPVQGCVVEVLLTRGAAPDDGQCGGRIAGRQAHDRSHPLRMHRQPEVEQRRAAGDPQFPVFGVVGEQPAAQVGVHLDAVGAEPEFPGLGVEQGRGHACGRHHPPGHRFR